MVLRILVLCFVAVGVRAALRGQDITKRTDALREREFVAATHLRTFGRDIEISNEEYVKAQAHLEDIKHRKKLIHYVGLGLMTNKLFEKVAEIQAKITDIQIRHHFVTDKKSIHKFKLDSVSLNKEWTEIMDPIKSQAHQIDNKEKIERENKIIDLRRRIATVNDREEMALLRLELEGMYADRPQPTPMALEMAARREKQATEIKRRAVEREGGKFLDGRYPDLTERETAKLIKLREKLAKATKREEVRGIREQMHAIKVAAVKREKIAHQKIVSESRRRTAH